jgi:RNase P protein component
MYPRREVARVQKIGQRAERPHTEARAVADQTDGGIELTRVGAVDSPAHQGAVAREGHRRQRREAPLGPHEVEHRQIVPVQQYSPNVASRPLESSIATSRLLACD